MTTSPRFLTPAEAAQQSGFTLDTLRYYERIGLLPGIGRAASGHRRFTSEDLVWLGILRCLRETGMPVADLRRYTALARGEGSESLAARLELLEGHDAMVSEQITRLTAQQQHLREKIAHYRRELDAG
jgi:DNA-binding transcriptional MerR regulator